jgi:protein SCO1/2
VKKFTPVAILLGAVLLSACGRSSAQPAGDVHAQHAAAAQDADAAAMAAAPASDLSVYQLESEWTDQHGRTRKLAELAGRPQAVAMVYTHCGAACPRIVGDLKRLEAEFPELGLVLVSIDPERDSPGRLHEFAQGSRLGERWTLLNGADGALMELAAVLGVRYRRVSDTEFMHSNLITVLDAAGNIAYRQEGLGETEGIAEALRGLRVQPWPRLSLSPTAARRLGQALAAAGQVDGKGGAVGI